MKTVHQYENRVKRIALEGRKTCGAWAQLGSPFIVEILSNAGFDWLMIDMEHSPIDMMTLVSMVQAMGATDTIPFARAPWNDPVVIKRILDTGVMGLLIPYVNSAEEAEMAVKACKYPPEGIRGVAGSTRAAGYGQNIMNYLSKANEEIMILTAIETTEAMDNLDEILTVPGLDGIFIGPMDLAASLGHLGNPNEIEVQEAFAVIEEKTLKSGKLLASLAGNWEQAQAKYKKGYNMLMLMADSTSLAALAGQKADEFKTNYPNG